MESATFRGWKACAFLLTYRLKPMKSKKGTQSAQELNAKSPHLDAEGNWKPDLDRYPYAPLRPGEIFIKVPPVLDKKTAKPKGFQTEKQDRNRKRRADKAKSKSKADLKAMREAMLKYIG